MPVFTRHRRSAQGPLVSVVVPAYGVAAYLPECLDSLLAQTHRSLEVVVVDDGSPDDCGRIADAYATRDPRVRVLHTANQGLGAARNHGVAATTGELIGFADGDDVLPPGGIAALVASLGEHTEADFAVGSLARIGGPEGEQVPRWVRRLHATAGPRPLRIGEHPELLGDVFAWNKLFRREFYERAGLSWPVGVRYEDQPTTTRAYLLGRFAVLTDVVYHWRVREDASSITQARGDLRDLRDRMSTKLDSLDQVLAAGDPHVLEIFRDRVLAGDLHRYFDQIPGCTDEWWTLLHTSVRSVWGERSLTHSGLLPVYRLTGWLVEQDRRTDAATVMSWVAAHHRPAPRVTGEDGLTRLAVPGLDPTGMPDSALVVPQ